MFWVYCIVEVCYMIYCSLKVFSVSEVSWEMLGLRVLRSSDCTQGTEGVEASTSRFNTLIEWVHEVLFCGWMCHLKGSSCQESSGCRWETASAGPSSPSFRRYEPYVNLIPNLQWIRVSWSICSNRNQRWCYNQVTDGATDVQEGLQIGQYLGKHKES